LIDFKSKYCLYKEDCKLQQKNCSKKRKEIQRVITKKKNILHWFLIKKTTTIKNKLYLSEKKNFDYLELQLITLNKLKITNKECTRE